MGSLGLAESPLVRWLSEHPLGFAVGLYVSVRLLRLWRPRGFTKIPPADRVLPQDVSPAARPGRTGVLLVNLGTPDELSVRAVRKYLREFLMDERVIDAPYFCRWMLINLIIAPFRASGSRTKYARIWDSAKGDRLGEWNERHRNNGSPLVHNSVLLRDGVRKALGDDFVVELAMRYQTPSIEEGLMTLKRAAVEHIIVLPLFPQYASATTGSVHCKVFDVLSKWDRIPHITMISSWVTDGLADCFVRSAEKHMRERYDYYIFSYHGIPEKYIAKGNFGGHCRPDFEDDDGTGESCCAELTERNCLCYRAQCYETTRRIVKRLGIKEGTYRQTFQSRLGPTKWLGPYTDEVIQRLPEQGRKRVLVFSPAFTADCLETLDEIGNEARAEFEQAGGEHLQLVPSLNGSEVFAETVAQMCRRHAVAAGQA
eukprot:TRINITY_DN60454_c0_g1_i1.p1 TRINITY_DN60454_c0_g1~~TRINITY_DN60454_c0_g1_i1.p1  ORF type:complete len:427 (+),score=142.55 TRINITY_DN60454_c0_g1_i1:72-1352(+)